MRSLVNFEVLRSGKHFSTSGEWTWEGFLARVNSNVVDQLVLGFEGLPCPGAILPIANVTGLLWASYVFYCDMGHQFMHCGEGFIARFFGFWLVLVYPEAGEVLFERLSHVAEEGIVPRRHHHVHVRVDLGEGVTSEGAELVGSVEPVHGNCGLRRTGLVEWWKKHGSSWGVGSQSAGRSTDEHVRIGIGINCGWWH